MSLILTVNAGSSSVKLALFELAAGLRRIAERHVDVAAGACGQVVASFLAEHPGATPAVVAHRVVHGGESLTAPCEITAAVEAEIEHLAPLAPLHNPVALGCLRATRDALHTPAKHLAVFDTGFYAYLPEVAKLYALPPNLRRHYGVRRYGFHGLAHQSMLCQWHALHPETKGRGRVISLQLGAGCSITASRDGRPVETSMGFSPLGGLVMATRAGDLDPGVMLFLLQTAGFDAAGLEHLLDRHSGLAGVSGLSGDMRVLLSSDHPDAVLAIELYCYRIRKYLGAYMAVLGGLDAVLFGGGVGEHAPQIRVSALRGLEWLGLNLDAEANRSACAGTQCISAERSAVELWAMASDEESMLAQAAADWLSAQGAA